MATKWTPEQEQAINIQGKNLLVAAAAGSGKTAVLVERIIKKLLNKEAPVMVDELLVVTFTRAAAAEMKERIKRRLEEVLEKDPSNELAARQISNLQKASITTIDSFCLSVIKNNIHLLDIDPNFTIINEEDKKFLRRRAFDDAFDELYFDEDNEYFRGLCEKYAEKEMDNLKTLAIEVYEVILSNPSPFAWLKGRVNIYDIPEGVDIAQTEYGALVIKELELELVNLIDIFRKCENWMLEESYINYMGTLELDSQMFMELLGKLEKSSGWDEITTTIGDISFERLNTQKGASDMAKTLIKEIRDRAKKYVEAIQGGIFAFDSTAIRESSKQLYCDMQALYDYIHLAHLKFQEMKNVAKAYDFSDLNHMVLNMFRGEDYQITPLAKDYRKRFKEIMIDEYQDSNMVQEYILTAVSGQPEKNNVFMVGDIKQSIYSFRQAVPYLFLDKYKSYPEDENSELVQLYKNFRSRREILEGANLIFERIMSERAGDIDYNQEESLFVGASFPELPEKHKCPCELILIESGNADQACRDQASYAAYKIKQLMDPSSGFMVTDTKTGELRPPRYSDFAILSRSIRKEAPIYEQALRDRGIPVFSDVTKSMLNSYEMNLVIAFLNVLSNPYNDISLAALLRSPVYNFTNEDLLEIRAQSNKARFYDCLQMVAQAENSRLYKKARFFLAQLNEYRGDLSVKPLSQIVWDFYNKTNYLAYVGALEDGARRQTNLRSLAEKIQSLEESGFSSGVYEISEKIKKSLKEEGSEFGEPKQLSEEDDVVRIMSIHMSKGLEFPVVIQVNLAKDFVNRPKAIVCDNVIGVGTQYIDLEDNTAIPSWQKNVVTKYKFEKEKSEEMRLLYVAMTRAKERLIMIGARKNILKYCYQNSVLASLFSDKLPPRVVRDGNSYLSWVTKALASNSDFSSFMWKQGYELGQQENEERRGSWGFNYVEIDDFTNQEEEEGEEAFEKVQVQREDLLEIDRKLSAPYLEKAFDDSPLRLSVSEINRIQEQGIDENESASLFEKKELIFKKPSFTKKTRGFSASEIGTIYHHVFAQLEYDREYTFEDVEQLLSSLVMREILSEDEMRIVNKNKIFAYTQSDIFAAAMKAKRVYKEQSFNHINIIQGKEYTVQGVIDLFYVKENGRVALVDFKTNKVSTKDALTLIDVYRQQLSCYKAAIEGLTGYEVDECWLYLVELDMKIACDL